MNDISRYSLFSPIISPDFYAKNKKPQKFLLKCHFLLAWAKNPLCPPFFYFIREKKIYKINKIGWATWAKWAKIAIFPSNSRKSSSNVRKNPLLNRTILGQILTTRTVRTRSENKICNHPTRQELLHLSCFRFDIGEV